MRKHKTICHVCHEAGADEIDHVVPYAEGGTDDDDNLRPIHSSPCHERKTQEERRRGRARANGKLEQLDDGRGGVPPRPGRRPGSRGAANVPEDEFPTPIPDYSTPPEHAEARGPFR